MVELGVDEGDVEAPRVEQLGQLQHRRDMSLRWVQQAYGMRLLLLRRKGTHARLSYPVLHFYCY